MMRVKFKDGSVVDYVSGDTAIVIGIRLVIFDELKLVVAELVASHVEWRGKVQAPEPEFGAAV